MAIYEMDFTSGKMVPHNDTGKDALEVGRVLKLNGYSNPEFVIVGALNEHRMYPCINREDFRPRNYELFALKFLSEKKDGRIQTYITDEVADAFEVANLIRESAGLMAREAAEKIQAANEAQRLEDIGREIAAKKIPAGCPALIVAELREDESDSMSDYYGSRGVRLVVLGVSAHKRDVFSEMKKFATKFPATAHLAEDSKYEHREKYSMGRGYYLAQYGYHHSGWVVSKMKKYGNDWDRSVYIALAKESHQYFLP